MKKQITIRDVIENPNFKGLEVICGDKGLDKKVSSITILDSPDPFKWTKGGEIVLTSGYIFEIHKYEFLELIKKLDESGIAAIFIKLERYIKKIPKEVIEYCNESGFTLVNVPLKYAFIEIINPTLSQIVNTQAEEIKKSNEIQKRFTDLVINNDDTQTIIEVISEMLNEELAYYDLSNDKIYYSKENTKFSSKIKNLSLIECRKKFKSYRIGVGNELYAYLIFNKLTKEQIEEDNFNILSNANTALVLDMQKKISSKQIEGRHRNEFIQDILLNNIRSREEVFSRANTFSWNILDNLRVLVVDIDNFKDQYISANKHMNKDNNIEKTRETIFKISKNIVTEHYKNSMVGYFSDSCVFVLGEDEIVKNDSILDNVTKAIKNAVEKSLDFTVTIGVSSLKNDVMELKEGYKEAVMCVKIGRVLHKRNTIMHYSNLGVFKLLYSVYENEDVIAFKNNAMGDLINYDKKNKSDLVKTLICIIDCDWNLKDASSKLFIHYNTIKYRYKKIGEILNRDLNLSENRLDLSLAIKIQQMIN